MLDLINKAEQLEGDTRIALPARSSYWRLRMSLEVAGRTPAVSCLLPCLVWKKLQNYH
jgi:hypothetical protein